MLDSISFIGGGVMAEAMIQGLLAKGLVPAGRVTASDPRRKRQEELHQLCGIRVTGDNVQAAQAGEIVVFAVKPQVLGSVLQELKGALDPRQMVMSIVAGARIDTMREALCHDAIVRVMPNTPAQIGQGISVWTATEGCSQDTAGPGPRHPAGPGQRDLRGRREVPGHGHGGQRHGARCTSSW